MQESTYSVPPRGLATSFTESELPPEYAAKFRNRFINAAGGAEERPGIAQLGNTIAGTPNVTGMHELTKKDTTEVLFVSGGGVIYKYDDVDTFTAVHSGLDTTAKIRSVQFKDRLIFFNGVDRNIYTEDGTTFKELLAVIEQGQTTTGTGIASLHDSDVTNWTTTGVAVNDIVYNVTTSTFGVITAVTSASIAHTTIAVGPNATGLGVGGGNQTTAQFYQIIDAVELNIIPNLVEDDNVGLAQAGTSATGIKVSGVNFANSEARTGDWVRNTTRNALTRITSISASVVACVSVAGQTSGDSLIFLKSAMPISSAMHTHYNRLYHVDSRDRRKIRISATDDATDMTSDSGTFEAGALQPEGDYIKAIGSFQRFAIFAGAHNVYAYQGVNPVGATQDFEPVGVFPQGLISADGLLNIGNDVVFVGPDGLQALSLADDASNLNRDNLSAAINRTLRDELADASEADIQLFHYPKRSWIVLKVGTKLYAYNYTVFIGEGAGDRASYLNGSWSEFDGKFAQANTFLYRTEGVLLLGGAGGKIWTFDQGSFDDDGDEITTELETGWLTMEEPKRRVASKRGVYIKPLLFVGDNITYTVRADAPFSVESTDTIQISAFSLANAIGVAEIGVAQVGGSSVFNEKYSLRWFGEVMKLNFRTSDRLGPDVISRYTIYHNPFGRR